MNLRSEPDVNYVWIGPPASKVKNQDIAAPIQMAELKKNVTFWCLREHQADYEAILKPKGIKVSPIEELGEIKHPNPAIQSAINKFKIMQKILLQPSRNTIRDRVTLKNATSLLLMLLKGGYYFDTNVEPTTNEPFNLPAYDTFKYPYLRNCMISEPGRFIIYNVGEVWALYAPNPEFCAPKLTENLASMFEYFFDNWNDQESLFLTKRDSEEYHNKMGEIIVKAVEKFSGADHHWTLEWKPEWNERNTEIEVEELRVKKKYHRTHVKQKNLEEKKEHNVLNLEEILVEDVDIEEKSSDEYINVLERGTLHNQSLPFLKGLIKLAKKNAEVRSALSNYLVQRYYKSIEQDSPNGLYHLIDTFYYSKRPIIFDLFEMAKNDNEFKKNFLKSLTLSHKTYSYGQYINHTTLAELIRVIYLYYSDKANIIKKIIDLSADEPEIQFNIYKELINSLGWVLQNTPEYLSRMLTLFAKDNELQLLMYKELSRLRFFTPENFTKFPGLQDLKNNLGPQEAIKNLLSKLERSDRFNDFMTKDDQSLIYIDSVEIGHPESLIVVKKEGGYDIYELLHDFNDDGTKNSIKLGSGWVGVVQRGRNVLTGEPVAIKKIPSMGDGLALRSATTACEFASELKETPNVTKLYGFGHSCDEKSWSTAENNSFYQVMEYHPKTLSNVVRYNISKEDKIKWLKQAVSICKIFSEQGIAHPDYQAKNILLDKKDNLVVCDLDVMYRTDDGPPHPRSYYITSVLNWLYAKQLSMQQNIDLAGSISTIYNRDRSFNDIFDEKEFHLIPDQATLQTKLNNFAREVDNLCWELYFDSTKKDQHFLTLENMCEAIIEECENLSINKLPNFVTKEPEVTKPYSTTDIFLADMDYHFNELKNALESKNMDKAQELDQQIAALIRSDDFYDLSPEIINKLRDQAKDYHLNLKKLETEIKRHTAYEPTRHFSAGLYNAGNTFFSKVKGPQGKLFQWYEFDKVIECKDNVAILDDSKGFTVLRLVDQSGILLKSIEINDKVNNLISFPSGDIGIIGETNIHIYDQEFKIVRQFSTPSTFSKESLYKGLADGSIANFNPGFNDVEILKIWKEADPQLLSFPINNPTAVHTTLDGNLLVTENFGRIHMVSGYEYGNPRSENSMELGIQVESMSFLSNDEVAAIKKDCHPPKIVVFNNTKQTEIPIEDFKQITTIATLKNGFLAIGDKNAGMIKIYEWREGNLINKAQIKTNFKSECAFKDICEKHLTTLKPTEEPSIRA